MLSTLLFASVVSFSRARVTGYDYASSCHNRHGGDCLTASGVPVAEGQAACPRNIPLGSIVVVGDKLYICTDRYARWLDVKYPQNPTFDIFHKSCTRDLCGLTYAPASVWILSVK